MNKKKKLIILTLSLLIILSLWISYESRYFNRVEFLSPFDFQGDIPIRNDVFGSGEFGAPRNGGRAHAGLDILAQMGSPVKATRSGRVINAESKPGLGKYVEIRHPGGFISIYAHLSEINVKNHQRIRQGEIIGKVGKSGNARYKKIKPHLHFEIRKDNKPVNPRDYL